MKQRFAAALLVILLAAGAVPAFAEKEANDALREKALAGDKKAAFELGNEYFYGTETRKANPVLAAHWFKTASPNFPEAMFNYGLCLEQGLGVERDPVAAAECYRIAAEKKCMPAEYNYALILKKGLAVKSAAELEKYKEKDLPKIDPVKATAMLQSLAARNYVPAMVEYAAELVAKSNDISAETAGKAFDLASRAVKQPDAPARAWRVLGDCYFSGIGTLPNGEKMIEALETAVAKGSLEALTRLGYCFEFGINVKMDQAKALAYYERAAKAELPAGMLKYADFIASGAVKDKGLDAAVEWYEKSALAGNPEALYRLGTYAARGIGLEKNLKIASEFFLEAAKRNHLHAQYELACMYLQKDGPVVPDDKTAFYWFERAAEAGDAASMRKLAQCHAEGAGCTMSLVKAAEWMQKAAAAGDRQAAEMLSRGKILTDDLREGGF